VGSQPERLDSRRPGLSQPPHRFCCQAIAVRAPGASTNEKPTRVLVVDDELNITELVSLGLRYEGFDVSSAHDGRGALRAIATSSPNW
jgi:PleD family two-component response regulator